MTPLVLTISGFRSFRTEQSVTFPQEPGLHRVLGVNEQEPRLGSNGAGKSSLFDALCWCLYGRTARGLRRVAAWGTTVPPRVQFTLRDPRSGKRHTVDRHGTALLLDHRPVEQQAVDDLVGCGHATFLATVLLGQFNPLFLDLQPAAKLQALEEVLDLERWRRAASAASERVRDAEREEQQLREEHARLAGQHDALQKQATQSNTRHAEWERDRGRDAREVATQTKAAVEQLARAEKEYQRYRTAFESAEATLAKRRQDLLEADNHLRLMERAGAKLSEALAAVVMNLRHAEDAWEAVRRGRCETCGQALPRGNESVKDRFAKARKDAGECQDRLQRAAEAITAAVDARKVAETEFVRAEKGVREVGDTKTGAGRVLQRAKDLVKAVQERAARVAGADNPHKAPLAAARASLRRCEEEGKAVATQMAAAAVKREAAGYWPRGFKELRLWLADEAVTQLEVEVNNSLLELGLEGWTVRCALERETQQGTVSKGFTVEVEAPGGRKAPWEAWCGGETQRLRVAGALGLAGLARARLGVGLALEVWDEPTQHLGKEGVRDLLEYFAQRAQAEGRVIYLIDHRAHAEGAFDGTVTIRKGTKGSVIE